MFVKNRMQKPNCISKDITISKTLDLMSETNCRRLPVVENDKLIGLITESTISSNTPSQATSLSIYELNYILSKTKVSDIMIKNVYTCFENDLIEDAAYKMLKNNVKCLPVVDENNSVKGIITHRDIYESFIDLLGYWKDGVRFVISVDKDKPGILQDIAKPFFDLNVTVYNMAVYHNNDEVNIVIISQPVDIDKMKDKLINLGYNVKAELNKHIKS